MTAWLMVGLLGGLVGLDATAFPQAMLSRPLVAGTLTGAIFGRPLEGAILGFVMEAFALITLPIGASTYPESGTATVAATAAYLAAVDGGLAPGMIVVALAFALGWERLAGGTVVLQRRNNGQILIRGGALDSRRLERRHLTAMTTDFVRGGVVAASGGVIGHALLRLVDGRWGLPETTTWGAVTVLVATMIGTMLPLFGGARLRRLAWMVGLAVGLALTVAL